mmetsp:Transcript_19762/g.37177  ORF Transcript_19762/g.37177 Transcript_19762/m.37177 type:complete len:349 (+) Transcript_19762:119-1165(+)
MALLYLVCDFDNVVFTFSATSNSTWLFSRLSDFHQENGKDRFVIRRVSDSSGNRWVLENQSKGAGNVFGAPKYPGNGPPFQGQPSPPRGMWMAWDCPFHLTDVMPRYDAIPSPFTLQVTFVDIYYREEGQVAYLDLMIRETPIDDTSLENAMQEMRRIMLNLAQRPEMVLLIKTDARRASSVPALRHVRKFLSFIQKDVGTESVLVGRGSAIVLVPTTFLGRAILGLVQLVQRMLPAPFPQTIVPSPEEADSFLATIASQYAQHGSEASEGGEQSDTADAETNHQEPVCIEKNLDRAIPPKGLQKHVSFAADVSEASDTSEAALEVQSVPRPARNGGWFWCVSDGACL